MGSTLKITHVIPLKGKAHPTPIMLPKAKSPLIDVNPTPAGNVPKAPYIGKQVGV